MYQLLVGNVFESTYKAGKYIPLLVNMLMENPPVVTFHFKVEEWQHHADAGDDAVFCWDEIAEGVFIYSLYRPSDPEHHGRPYWWSSRSEILDRYAGTNTVNISGKYAVSRDLVIIPHGYLLREDGGFLVPIEET